MSNNLKKFARELGKYTLLSSLGLLITCLIRNNLSYVGNNNPFGLSFDPITTVTITTVTLFYWLYAFYQSSSLSSGLILVGIVGNSLEKIIWGNVADYIPFIISTINHFDLMIWLGLGLYIHQIFFKVLISRR